MPTKHHSPRGYAAAEHKRYAYRQKSGYSAAYPYRGYSRYASYTTLTPSENEALRKYLRNK